MISKLCLTILTVSSFLPLFLPCIIRLLTSLHNGALSLTEPLGCVPPSRVGQELGELVLGGDVVLQGHVGHLDILAAPLPEELHLRDLGNDRGGGQLLHGGLTGPIFSHLDRVFLLLL